MMSGSVRRSGAAGPTNKLVPAVDHGWTALTWGDVEKWVGSRSVARGRTYQRGKRVKELRITSAGKLLATVIGSDRYATAVSLLGSGVEIKLVSSCTCPIGGNCKHVVAVVADYLDAVANGRDVPLATDDDPRWQQLDESESGSDEGSEPADGGDDEHFEEPPTPAPRNSRTPKASARGWSAAEANAKVEQHIRALSPAELGDLAWSLVQRFPAAFDEIRERLAMDDGDVATHIAETRREIERVTAESAWRNHWDGNGSTPDYSKVRRRLQRLAALGRPDDVVTLGKVFLQEGLRQLAGADDEGEAAQAFREVLPVIFQALLQSRLPVPERLIFAIDAELSDDIEAMDDASGVVYNADVSPADWSVVADKLMARLGAAAIPATRDTSEFSRNYARDRLTQWIGRTLANAGRSAELDLLIESEARITGNYARLVDHLIAATRFEDAERRAKEGITAQVQQHPALASGLANRLLDMAKRRRQWDVIAAHAAEEFFRFPSVRRFDELLAAAAKAGVEAGVRTAALKFLETGAAPIEVAAATSIGAPRAAQRKKTDPATSAPVATPVLVDPNWPLPALDYLVKIRRWSGPHRGSGPHLDVLVQMAIEAKRPDEALLWYDKMLSEQRGRGALRGDHVAAAVTATHPQRAMEIYRAALDAQLPQPHPAAYQAATAYLKTLRPIYVALDRAAEWSELVRSIREKYRNRPRFMEMLDSLEYRPIVEAAQKRRR